MEKTYQILDNISGDLITIRESELKDIIKDIKEMDVEAVINIEITRIS